MKQNLWIYAVLLGLTALFLVVSALIFLFGTRPGLVARKLKIGTMIIALNAVISGCYSSGKTAEETSTGGDTGTSTLGGDTGSEARPATTDSEIMDIECYDAAYPTDTGGGGGTDSADNPPTDIGIPTDALGCYDTEVVECYDACYDTGTENDTDTSSSATDIECYAAEYSTDTGDTDTDSGDAQPTDIPTDNTGCYDTDYVECYDMVDVGCYDTETITDEPFESPTDTDSPDGGDADGDAGAPNGGPGRDADKEPS